MSLTNKRSNFRWSVNEILRLEREYELLEWSIQDIAREHQRTVNAILYKLQEENIISCWEEARGFDVVQYKDSLDNDASQHLQTNKKQPVIAHENNESDDDYHLDEDDDDEDDDDSDDEEYCLDNDSDDEDYYLDDDDDEDDEYDEDDDMIQCKFDKIDERMTRLEKYMSSLEEKISDIKVTILSMTQKKSDRKPLREYL
jgi:hypothetical protein